MNLRPTALALLTACSLLGAGCGAGAEGPQTTLVVTRDFGAVTIGKIAHVPTSAGLTAIRQLQSARKTTTSYGGRYVDSIDGVKEDATDSWLYYVNGIEQPRGAASVRLKAGERTQWDFHPWQMVRTGGAIVGAYPQPLRSAGVQLVCAVRRSAACAATRRGLAAAGVPTGGDARVVVGTYKDIARLDGVPKLTAPGDTNGAYAQFSADGRRLTPFRADGSQAPTISERVGLLAPFASGGKITWLVTGTDQLGVAAAAGLLGSERGRLANRFAMLVDGDVVTPLPEVTAR